MSGHSRKDTPAGTGVAEILPEFNEPATARRAAPSGAGRDGASSTTAGPPALRGLVLSQRDKTHHLVPATFHRTLQAIQRPELTHGASQFPAVAKRPAENSPAFQRRVQVQGDTSPEGTAEPSSLNRPGRDSFRVGAIPALKRRAMVGCPCGTRVGRAARRYRVRHGCKKLGCAR